MPQRIDAMDWDKLRIFHTVAEAGSLTHAGDVLNLSQSAVSRQISALEESLKAPLFVRHARGLILTEQGELLYETTRTIRSNLTALETRFDEKSEGVVGPLIITTPQAFGTLWLTPRLKKFTEMYPQLELTIALRDRSLDLSMRRADLAVRFIPSEQPDFIQRHLIRMPYRIFSSPEYLKANGTPETLADLSRHRLIVYGGNIKAPADNLNWLLSTGLADGEPTRAAALRISNLLAIAKAVESGQGIAALPAYFCCDPGNMVQIMDDLETPFLNLYFIYTKEMRHRKRVEIFRDFLLSELAACDIKA